MNSFLLEDAMTTISMSELCRKPEEIIRKIERGECIVLTYQGRPVARLEPIETVPPDKTDPFYNLPVSTKDEDKNLKNEEIDRIIYG